MGGHGGQSPPVSRKEGGLGEGCFPQARLPIEQLTGLLQAWGVTGGKAPL